MDDKGLSHYGECTMVLRDKMIRHRATVFEENSAVFVKRNLIDIENLPAGRRAVWENRSKAALVKSASKLQPTTEPSEYPQILLQDGVSSADDIFVEVHIWGPMTIRSVEKISIDRKKCRGNAVFKATALLSKKFDVGVMVI